MSVKKVGILLINTGTPTHPTTPAVRRYLREFLGDPRIIDIPWLWRQLLLYIFILPFRPQKSAEAYRSVWLPEGSPLMHFTKQLVNKLQNNLGGQFKVELGMRYAKPSIFCALQKLMEAGCDVIKVIPLFPQYSSAANGSAIAKVFDYFKDRSNIPHLEFLGAFHDHPKFIEAYVELIKVQHQKDSYLLLSYHGLPERQIQKSEQGVICKDHECPLPRGPKRFCYRAQAYETSSLIAEALRLQKGSYSTAFQSRLGRTPWIKPYTDEVLPQLFEKGVRNLTMACPSFVTDCLETIEEIGIRAKEQWLELGGTSFTLIPCLNDSALWLDCLEQLIKIGPNNDFPNP